MSYDLINLNKNHDQVPSVTVPVFYRQIDNGHFQFDWDMGEDAHASMEESDTAYEYSRFNEAKYSEKISESERLFYSAAAASGMLSSCVDSLGITEAVLSHLNSNKDKSKQLRELMISAARLCGYKKKDYNGAVRFILDKIGAKNLQNGIFAELSSVPNATGLVFSLVAQFTGVLYSLDSSGSITNRGVPDYYVIGRNNSEKIVFGFLYWFFHMVLKSARYMKEQGSLGLPKELVGLVESLGRTTCFRNLKISDEELERKFSGFLKRLFEGTDILNGKNSGVGFDLEGSIAEHSKKLKAQVGSVLLNEGITRGLYTFIQMYRVFSETNLASFDDLREIECSQFLPANNRIVTNMCVISSGVFVLLNVAGAIGKALYGKKVDGRSFKEHFIANINIVGIGRFIFAIAQDAKYFGENIKVLFDKFGRAQNSYDPDQGIDFAEAEKVFRALRMEPAQVRWLVSLENSAIEYDIQRTKSDKVRDTKLKWHRLWIDSIHQMDGAQDEMFFIDDDREIYKVFFDLEQSGMDKTWYYLLTMELALFSPYQALRCKDDKEFAKLKRENDYVLDEFVRRQTIVDEKYITELRKKYDKYTGAVNGSTFAKGTGGAVMVGAAALGGSLAFAYAPVIAVALAGNALAGLHGAALTSAALAMFGGGSLAAGGFGMAGGTAVIAGGGALLALSGSGTVMSGAIINMISDVDRVKLLARLLTYADMVLLREKNDRKSVDTIKRMVESLIKSYSSRLVEMKDERNEINKESIKELEKYVKCLRNTEKVLAKM